MHELTFALKRAHLTWCYRAHTFTEPVGITPARFDMLHAIGHDGNRSQSYLNRLLGVSAPTVSRMLKSLRELDLIETRRGFMDRRERFHSLTARGLAILRRIGRKFIHNGFVDRLVARVLTRRPRFPIPEMEEFEMFLRRMRQKLGDRAELHYYYHPDD